MKLLILTQVMRRVKAKCALNVMIIFSSSAKRKFFAKRTIPLFSYPWDFGLSDSSVPYLKHTLETRGVWRYQGTHKV
jgi:hypothetical protein